MENKQTGNINKRFADTEVLEMLDTKYTELFSDELALKKYLDFWSNTNMEFYSTQNKLYFMQQAEARGEQNLKYFASKTKLQSYQMDIKPTCVDSPYDVLIPITIGQKYGIDKIYSEVSNVLNSKDKEAVFQIESANLYFFKEKENHISAYNASNKIYLFRNIPAEELLNNLKAIKEIAVEWKIQNVYNIEQCLPKMKQTGGKHYDKRAIVYHEQVPGTLSKANDTQKNILASVIKDYAFRNNLSYDSSEKNVEQLVKSVLTEKLANKSQFEKDMITYVALRQFGADPSFDIKIPLEYQRQSLSNIEKRNILDDINEIYKKFKSDIVKGLEENGLDMQLNSIKDYQEEKLSQSDAIKKAAYYKDRITKKEYIINYATSIVNSDTYKSKEEINELVENLSHIAICSQRLKDLAYILEKSNFSQSDKEKAFVDGSAVLDKLRIYETKLQNSINTYMTYKENFVQQEHDQQEKNFAELYNQKPYITLLELQENGEKKLQGLTRNQLAYIAKSTYLKSNYAKYLKHGKEKFLEKAVARLDKIEDAVSKHGVYVEVNFSENILKEQMFYSGQICGIKEFNKLVAKYEKEIQKEKKEYAKLGKEFPSSECQVTVFAPTLEKNRENAAYYKIDDTKLMEVEFDFELGNGDYKDFKDVIVEGIKEITTEPGFSSYEQVSNFLNSIDKSFKERISPSKQRIEPSNIEKSKNDIPQKREQQEEHEDQER